MRPIQGQLLRLSARREVAIYLRDGTLWVADFVDGNGELFEPETWFRFNCGTPGAQEAQRRMLRESGLPLSADMVEKIEGLHRSLAASGGRVLDRELFGQPANNRLRRRIRHLQGDIVTRRHNVSFMSRSKGQPMSRVSMHYFKALLVLLSTTLSVLGASRAMATISVLSDLAVSTFVGDVWVVSLGGSEP